MKDSRREKMKKAVEDHRNRKAEESKAAVATVATPATVPKVKRSARARDARAAGRGRLPLHSRFNCQLQQDGGYGLVWSIDLEIWAWHGDVEWRVKKFHVDSNGLWEGQERLDIMFWEWYAAPGEEDVKSKLTFAERPPLPEGGRRE